MMSKRIAAYKEMFADAWYSRQMAKLAVFELKLIEEFIRANDEKDHKAFEATINRMYLTAEVKTRNWALIQEVLSSINTKANARSVGG